jgi:hypothetical protein
LEQEAADMMRKEKTSDLNSISEMRDTMNTKMKTSIEKEEFILKEKEAL